MITAPRVTFSFSANAKENVDATVVLCHSGFGFECVAVTRSESRWCAATRGFGD